MAIAATATGADLIHFRLLMTLLKLLFLVLQCNAAAKDKPVATATTTRAAKWKGEIFFRAAVVAFAGLRFLPVWCDVRGECECESISCNGL